MCHHVVVAARVDLICVKHMFDAQDMMHFSSVKLFNVLQPQRIAISQPNLRLVAASSTVGLRAWFKQQCFLKSRDQFVLAANLTSDELNFELYNSCSSAFCSQ